MFSVRHGSLIYIVKVTEMLSGQEDTSVIALYAYQKRTNSDIGFEKVLIYNSSLELEILRI